MTERRCYQCRFLQQPIIKHCPGPNHGPRGQDYWRCRFCLMLNDLREEMERAAPEE